MVGNLPSSADEPEKRALTCVPNDKVCGASLNIAHAVMVPRKKCRITSVRTGLPSMEKRRTAKAAAVVQKSRAPRQRDGDVQWFFSAKAFRPSMIYIYNIYVYKLYYIRLAPV